MWTLFSQSKRTKYLFSAEDTIAKSSAVLNVVAGKYFIIGNMHSFTGSSVGSYILTASVGFM